MMKGDFPGMNNEVGEQKDFLYEGVYHQMVGIREKQRETEKEQGAPYSPPFDNL